MAPSVQRSFLPNFIADSEIENPPKSRSQETIRLIYVGAVSQVKGAESAALVLQVLQKECPTASLTLIGAFEETCRNCITAFGIPNVNFTGPMNTQEIQKLLDESHYFIFLTHWPGEGHSNSLTEAMGRGCVPIYTKQGFNESIAVDSGICVENRNEVSKIAKQVFNNWNSSKFITKSQKAVDQVSKNFSVSCIQQTLRNMHDPDQYRAEQ